MSPTNNPANKKPMTWGMWNLDRNMEMSLAEMRMRATGSSTSKAEPISIVDARNTLFPLTRPIIDRGFPLAENSWKLERKAIRNTGKTLLKCSFFYLKLEVR